MRLLLVEDDKRLANALTKLLQKNNYGVDNAFDGEIGQQMAETEIYDLIILDRMLPKKEGVTILKDIRKQGIKTPVLILTAKDTTEDKVNSLDAGADDYLIKPFAPEELLARIRALSRRNNDQFQSTKMQFAQVTLDPQQCEVTDEKVIVRLTAKESLLLELFMRNPGQVITKEQIMDRVWGFDSDVEMNIVEIYIHYLRKKLIPFNSIFFIENLRGVGYLLKEVFNVSQT